MNPDVDAKVDFTVNEGVEERMRSRPLKRLPWQVLAAGFVMLCSMLLSTRSAHAYPWMIRHDYAGCGMCHVDPSGAGVLTAYGRAQGDLLLRTRYDGGNKDEADRSAGFLWGLLDPPAWFLPSGSLRTLGIASKLDGQKFTTDFILMQADLRAAVATHGFRAYASAGVVGTDGSAASISGDVVSREHWLGYAFGQDEAFLVRAGRMNLPFGIRSIEHTMFVRSVTRTDLNDTQQHGVAFAYSGDSLRGELLGIAGNYQISPDAYRERGYSGYLEFAPLSRAAFGVSSLVTHAQKDLYMKVANTRQAHGVFARVAPWQPLVLLFETDLLLAAPSGAPSTTGYASMLQADYEPIQGVHVIVTGESMHQSGSSSGASYSGWLGADWFFLPHADVRIDAVRQSLALGPSNLSATSFLGQFHVYL